jgi:thiol-disulfide isomerase/thioredoxin
MMKRMSLPAICLMSALLVALGCTKASAPEPQPESQPQPAPQPGAKVTTARPANERSRSFGSRQAAIASLVLAAATLTACQPAAPQGRDTLADEMSGHAGTVEGEGEDERAERVAIGPAQGDTDVSGIVGKPAPGWQLARWFNSPPLTVESLRGSVVLVRWLMSPECPLCSATAPSLNAFHEQYAARGLRVIGMYHHKGKQPLDPADVEGYVEHYGFAFPVAIDPDWQTLRRWWLDGHDRSFTSVSFLVDRAGTVRHVHLGGKYAPGSADHAQMQRWIESLLAER